MDRAELIIKLTGDREALTSLKNLEAAMKNLNNSKAQLRVDKSLLDREIADVRNQIKALTKERYAVKLEGGDTAELDAQIRNLRDNLDALTAERRSIQLDISDINLANSGLKEAKEDLEEANQAAIDFINTLAGVFDGLSNIAGATASFANGIGDAFTSMAGLFDSNLFDYMQRKLTYMFTEGIVGDVSRIVSRYDILSTFTQYMDAAGVASDNAATALQRVNDAILGLPIGLDEAAYRLRRYQMFIGDINDATNLTIGLQNALLAGGASEGMRNIAYQQIDRLLSAGKLNTSRQWLALIQGLGVSLRYVTEEMGVTGMTTREFAAGLTNGTISTDQFLRALMNLGEGTSQAARGLSGLLDIYRTTLESWISNIQFAAVRGGETVLKSLNEALLDVTDQGIVGYLRDLRDAMNEFYKGVGGFITGNPELLDRMIGSIQGLFDAIGRFSASDTATLIFNNLARGVDLLTRALNQLPTDEVEQFISFAVTLAGPLGALFDIVASGAPFVIAVFERFKDFDFEHLLDRIIEEVGRLAGVFETLLNLLSDEALTEIITFGLVYGGPAAAGFSAVADAFQGIASALILINGLQGPSALSGATSIFAGLKGAVAGLPELIARVGSALSVIAGPVAALAAAVGVMQHLAEGETQNFRQQYGFANRMSRDELEKWISDAEQQYAAMQREYRLQSSEMSLPGEDEDLGYKMRALGQDIEEAKGVLDSMGPSASGAADGLNEFADAVTTATDAEEKAVDTSQTLESRLTEINNRISVAAEQVSSTLSKQIDIFTEYEQAATRAFTGENSLTSALDSNIKALEDYEKNLEAAARIIAENPDIGFDVSSLFQRVVAGGLDSAGDLAGLVEAFENDYDAFLGYIEKYVEEQELQISVESWAAMLSAGLSSEDMALKLSEDFGMAIGNALKRVPEVVAEGLSTDALREEMFALKGGKAFEGVGEGLKEQFSTVGQSIAEGVAEGVAEADMSEAGQQFVDSTADAVAQADKSEIGKALTVGMFDDVTVDIEGLLNAIADAVRSGDMDPISQAFAERLPETLSGFTTLMSEEGAELFVGFVDLRDLLNDLYEVLGTIYSGLGMLRKDQLAPLTEETSLYADTLEYLNLVGIEPLETSTVEFYETHIPELIIALINLIDRIRELIDELESLNDTLEETRRRTDELKTASDQLAHVIQAKIPVMQQFIGVIDGIGSAAGEAAEAVAELAAAMSSLESKSVGLSFEAPSAGSVSGAGVIRPAYRASGGFIPRGTDTVPAMLTPGEFVMRRSAVKAFGVDFMKKLNNLDIGGMVAAMYRQIPHMAGFMPIYNNTYNNDNRNISVDQHIYTNNPSYTYRMASRWAHAL